jgi:pentapeptide repeat protein
MPDSPTPKLDSTFICECDEGMRSACAGEPFHKEHEGKRYCVLHFPSREKRADFEAALLKKLEKEDFNFCGAWFPSEVSFDKVEFSTAANFQFATFSAKASFEHARFTALADFRDATFMSEGHFFSTSFGRYANFTRTKFNGGVSFIGGPSSHELSSITPRLDAEHISRPRYSKTALTSCKPLFAEKCIFTTRLSLAT